MHINVGGSGFVEVDGTVWVADTFHGGAKVYSVKDTVKIEGTENDAMYRSEIYGEFTLLVPVATPGQYEIVMHFAELYVDTVGSRVFDIKLEGETVLSNLDLVEVTGSKFTAIQYSFFHSITDGAVTIEGVNIINNAKLIGVEIIPEDFEIPPTDGPAQTEASTFGPTDAPTMVKLAPTEAPTFGPTDAPTMVDPAPTEAPTFEPTDAPTMVDPALTEAPTFGPTDAPTRVALPTMPPSTTEPSTDPPVFPPTTAPTLSYTPPLTMPPTTPPSTTEPSTDPPVFPPTTAPTLSYTPPPTMPPTTLPSTTEPSTDPPVFPPTTAPTVSSTPPPTMPPTTPPSTTEPSTDPPTTTSTNLGDGEWIEVDSDADIVARREACFVFDDSTRRGYLIGGRDRRDTYPINIYNPLNRTWSEGAEPPMELHHMQCVVVDGRIWIVSAWTGGFPREKNVADIYIYDPQSNSWSTKAGLPQARQRGGAASVLVGRRIYVTHGNRGGHEKADFAETLGWLDYYDIDSDCLLLHLYKYYKGMSVKPMLGTRGWSRARDSRTQSF